MERARTTSTRRELTEREAFWLAHLRRIESAGIATKAYAARRGLSVHALYQARKQLVRLGAWPERRRSEAAPTFAPVRVIDTPVASVPACRLRFADGSVLEWSAAPAPEALAALLERVGGAR
jgi:hypothetical protein